MSELPDLPPGYVYVAVCRICKELPRACVCPEGFHGPAGIEPHPKQVHCCRCEAMTHEFLCWRVGDSYSFGPLCAGCCNSLRTSWCAISVDNPRALALIQEGPRSGRDKPEGVIG